MASTSRPVGVRLTDTSIFSWGIPADTNAARSASLSGLGLPATRFLSVDSTVDVVAATAGSAVLEGPSAALADALAPGLTGELAPLLAPGAVDPTGVVGGPGVAVQPVARTRAATSIDHPARRTLVVDAGAGPRYFEVLPLLIT